MNQLKLIQFKADAFAGIDKSQPVVIVFPDGYGGYAKLEGDQETHKTSTIEAFKASCGLPMPENAINRKENDRRVQFEFERNEKRYRVSISKSRFELEFLVEEGRYASLSSPKTMLTELLGPVGTSPMFLKGMEGKKQIEWLENFYRLTPEQLELKQKIETELTTTYNSRRDVKKKLNDTEKRLTANNYYINREQWSRKIEEHKAKQDETNIETIQRNYNTYLAGERKVETLKNDVRGSEASINDVSSDIDSIEDEIKRLQLKLEEKRYILEKKKEVLAEQKTNLTKGEQWLKDNSKFKDENERISKLAVENTEMATNEANFNQMLELEKQNQNWHAEYQRLENRLDEFRKAKIQFVKAITPEIEGLEVCVPDVKVPEEGDEKTATDTREGLFYNGSPIIDLSESQLWGLYSQILDKLNIKIIIIENITSLGSGAISLFNKFIESGGYVLASEMKREEKNLKVIVQNKISE